MKVSYNILTYIDLKDDNAVKYCVEPSDGGGVVFLTPSFGKAVAWVEAQDGVLGYTEEEV